MVPLLRVMHAGIRVRRPAIVRTLAAWLRQQPRPSAVVSVMPNFNGIMRDAIHRGPPRRSPRGRAHRLRGLPARFWIEPGIDRVVVATEEAQGQALASGWPRARFAGPRASCCTPGSTAGGADPRADARGAGLPAGFDGDAPLRGQGLARDGSPRRAAGRTVARPRVVAVCGENPGPLRAARAARGARRRAGSCASASPTAWPTSSPRATCSSPSPARARSPRPSTSACR